MSELIKDEMRVKVFLEGTVNHNAFKCYAEGKGNPYQGMYCMKIDVTEGGPLPFAFDILSLCFSYGQKVFIKYPKEIPDFFKQSFPEGYVWERVTNYEDGGVLSIYQETSLEGDCLISNVKAIGTNFPPNGPVMKKMTLGWEPSTETVYRHGDGLVARNTMALKLVGGGHLLCFLKTTFRSKKKITLPEYHFQDYRLERMNESDDGNTINQHERIEARYSFLPSTLGKNQTVSPKIPKCGIKAN